MNVRQENFCLEYAKCGNATEAAKKAGYSEKTAKSIGQRLLTYVDVKNRLQELANEIKNNKIMDVVEMQETLTAIIRRQMTEDIPMVVNQGTYSEVQNIEKTASFKDMVKAIETLGKMQGAFSSDIRLEIAPVVIKDDMSDDY